MDNEEYWTAPLKFYSDDPSTWTAHDHFIHDIIEAIEMAREQLDKAEIPVDA